MSFFVDVQDGEKTKTIRVGGGFGGKSSYYEEQGIETVSEYTYLTKYLKISTEIVDALFEQRVLVHKGERFENYLITENGNIVSISKVKKQFVGKHITFDFSTLNKCKILRPVVSGSTDYPAIGISVNGVAKKIPMHRLVCENFHELKKYPGIKTKDWRKLPQDVKKTLLDLMQVNHKDGDHSNYHPSNLEWVTAKQNRDHYHKVLRCKK